MTYWQRWIWKPHTTWLRKATFQVHLWSGIILGLYVLMVSVTGSILVYSNELYRAATPAPVMVAASGARLTDEQLKAAATRAYPGYTVLAVSLVHNPDQAVSITLGRNASNKNRLFNPYTGADLGDSVTLGIRVVSKLIELHDDLLAGKKGRAINGAGAVLLIFVALTGIVVWWPGIKTWRQGLILRRNVGWRRFTWDLHRVMGFWTLVFILLFAVSGAYLGNPEVFQDLADRIQPLTEANSRSRLVDQIIYWLAYLHFGRINGIGIPCSGPGLCDQTTKAVWAFFGLAPAAMVVTGVVIWWNRVVRKKLARTLRRPPADQVFNRVTSD